MPKHVTLLMEKNPDDRTERDLELIGREVRKLPSFRKYSARLQRMMCRIVRYMRYVIATVSNRERIDGRSVPPGIRRRLHIDNELIADDTSYD